MPYVLPKPGLLHYSHSINSPRHYPSQSEAEEQSVLTLQFEHDYILNALSFAGEFCGQYDCHAEADGQLSLLSSDQHLWLDKEWRGGEYTLSCVCMMALPTLCLMYFGLQTCDLVSFRLKKCKFRYGIGGTKVLNWGLCSRASTCVTSSFWMQVWEKADKLCRRDNYVTLRVSVL